jgi:phage gp29-like protein
MLRNKYLNFTGPSTSYGPTRDVTLDPVFDLESKTPYMDEIVTRATTFDYFRTSLLLPNPSVVLQKMGRNLEEFDQLLADARVKACMNNRRAGTLSLKWTIDQNGSRQDLFDLCKQCFEQYPLYDIISEMLLAPFYGYTVSEVNWEAVAGLYIPKSVIGKATRWLAWDEENQLRYKTKVQMTQGEPIPPRKIIVCRFNPTYQDPYSGNECLAGAIYWPVKFRHMTLQSAEIYIKRYAMPWVDAKVDGNVIKPERINELMAALKAGVDDNVFIHPETTALQLLSTSDSKSIENYTKYMDMLDREIDMCILGNNMSAEIKGGSFAAATALQGVRDDIIQSDVRMIENAWNQLIEWISWYNYPTDRLPKFRMYKHDPPTKERAEIDTMLCQNIGVKFDKKYIQRTYGLNDDEFEMGAPMAKKGPLGTTEPTGPTGTDKDAGGETPSKVDDAVQSVGIEAKDASTNKSTVDSIAKNQARGSPY